MARVLRTSNFHVVMRLRLTTTAVLAALAAVYLGLPCLALARSHDGMAQDHGAMAPDAAPVPCETSDAAAAELLCAAPSAYVPLTIIAPDVAEAALEPETFPPVPLATPQPSPAPRAPDVHGTDPPAFLLHRALLI